MLKDTKSLGNNKAPACESRGFVHKKRRCAFLHTFLYISNVLYYLLKAVATSTAQATVHPTIGLLPIPRNPIIST